MRVLVTVQPSHAHLWPITPVAWALQAAGHEVRVATHAWFTQSVLDAGLTPVALGKPGDVHVRMRPDADPPVSPEDVLRYAEVLGLNAAERENWIVFHQWLLTALADYVRPDLSEASDLIEFAQKWQPDLVIWDPTMAAGPLAARACGAAHARFLLALDYPGWCFDRLAENTEQLIAAGLHPNPQVELVQPIADKYGITIDDEMLFGQWSIDPMPLGMGLSTSGTKLPVRYVPYSGVEEFPDWLLERSERPRVALTLGESVRRFVKGDWGRTPKILEAVAGLDIEVIATLNSRQLEGIDHVPDNVRIIEWVSLTQLAPTCSAIIHHGGGGTFAAPIAFNVPQIVCDTDESLMMQPVEVAMVDGAYLVGHDYDESKEVHETVTSWELPGKKLEAPPAAKYVLARGAGTRLDHQTQSVEEIAAMISAVITDPAYRAGAQAAYDSWLALPSPADIVPALESLTREHRRR